MRRSFEVLALTLHLHSSPVIESSHDVPAVIGDMYVLVATACMPYFRFCTLVLNDVRFLGLFFYDYILLLPSEIRVVWGAPINLASTFYLSIRYGFFLQIVITLLQQLHISPTAGPDLSPGASVFFVALHELFQTDFHVCRCQGLLDVLIILNLINFCLIAGELQMHALKCEC